MPLKKNVLAVTGTAALLCLAVALHAVGQFGAGSPVRTSPNPSSKVQASTLAPANFDDIAPRGKEVDAIYGDIVLHNGFLSAVIAQPLATRHANMTVKDIAGALIDLSAHTESGGDQLAAFYPGRKVFPYRSVSLRDSASVELPPSAAGIEGKTAAVVVKAEGSDDRPEATVTYELRQPDPFITVTSSFRNHTSKPLKVALEDDFRADGGKEEMLRSPNGTSDRFWLCDQYWGQAYGLDAEGFKLLLTSDARITTIKYENAAGESAVMLAPGETFEFKRRLYPGGTIFDVQSVAGKAADLARVQISLDDRSQFAPGNLAIELSQGQTLLGKAPLNSALMLQTTLPQGDYTARIFFCGRPTETVESFHVAAGENKIALKQRVPRGLVAGHVTAVNGGGIPCKVELTALAENVKLDFGPESAEFAVRNLVYSPHGDFVQQVPPGKYAVTISHGPEFDIVQTEVSVEDGKETALTAKLVRSVETPGWVSSDFHSHSTPSGDNTSSQLGRVLNLVCENVEFAPCTEHNRVSTYEPHIDALKIKPFIASVSGIEMTGIPLPLNHQNAFPMKYTPRVQDGGGPVTGPDLETQIERLALWDDRSEKLLQVNHPDMGWMFYDKDGDGKPDAGFERAFPFMDVVEIHPISNALHLQPTVPRGTATFHNTVFNWLQLLNQGFRIYGVVNTDAHYNFHGSGFLRNWIQSSTDDPAQIDPMQMAHAAEQGRLVMSNGPYLEVVASETGKSEKVVSGQDLKASSGKVTLQVRVQCPNWLDVNRLTVLVNGRPHSVHDYSREKHSDAFRSGVVKFDRALNLELKGDAHLVVVTGHVGGSLGSVAGPSYGKAEPAALTNPIFVDVDGKGFQPNMDTLDAPLPVKHPNSK